MAYTIEADELTIAGWLEPAHDAGGDTFDYSLDREYLYASITDAMGHGMEAALLATVAVGSLRNSRRALLSAAEQSNATNDALRSSIRADQFVTGLRSGYGRALGRSRVTSGARSGTARRR